MHQAVEQKPCTGQAPERTNASADDNAACNGAGIIPSSVDSHFLAEKQCILLAEEHTGNLKCVHTRKRPTCKLGARGAAAALLHVPARCGKESWTCPGAAIKCRRVRILVRQRLSQR